MQKIVLFIGLLLFVSSTLTAQQPYKVVFDLTSKDTLAHQTVIRWIKLITESNKDARLEVVYYGQSLDMVTQGKSTVANDIIEYAKKDNISFKVCEAAMKHWKIEKNQLLPGVQTVPDGIYEIISKQGQGWGYIKVAR
ncbi:MAG TPA: DsrE family protein [Chitinophagaceae bacterium]|nr:DsrE family protein [Chitinophagaceae bacterium]